MIYIITAIIWGLIGFAGWKVFSRAGFKGYLGIFFLIPILNFVALLYLAHKPWPAITNKA
jgi:hypothetical protein